MTGAAERFPADGPPDAGDSSDRGDPPMPRTLVVTGHFPPEPGGVQTFTWELVRRLPPEALTVIAPAMPGAVEFDRTLAFPVIRRHGYLLFRQLRAIVRRTGARTAWVPAAAPFAMYTPWLRAAGIERLVVSTHGQELGWLRVWPTRAALGAALRNADVVTYLSDFTRSRLARVVPDAGSMRPLPGGVDLELFRPGAGGSALRARLGLADAPIVVTVGRLVRRKGHDVLLRSWPRVLDAVPGAHLFVIGAGPMYAGLREAAATPPLRGSVHVTGPLAADQLVAHLDAADAFVLACRDDRAGLQTEGLGLAVLEASAMGVPVVVGRSGGSPESVLPGRTGLLVDSTRPADVSNAILELLADPKRAKAMGLRGQEWVYRHWTWDVAVRRLRRALGALPQDTRFSKSCQVGDFLRR